MMNSSPEETAVEEVSAVEVKENSGLVQINLGMLQATNSEEMLAAAAEIATPLKKFIKDRGLFRFFGGDKPHVEASGWSTMIAMLGLFPQEIWVKTEPTKDEWGSKYIALVALVRISDGTVVCNGSAECGGIDEPDWHEKPKYVWEGPDDRRVKKQVGMQPVAGNSRRSMALTRAGAKAARMGFAWIMELAGYSPTPADEMGQDDTVDPDKPQPDEFDKEKTRQQAGFGAANNRKDQQNDQNKKIEVRQMKANYPFKCELCKGTGKADEEIAFFADKKGTGHTSHWNCWLDKQIENEEAAKTKATEEK